MTCYCCRADIPETAKTRLCPECFQALSAKAALPKIYCKVHKLDVDPTIVTPG